MTPELSQTQLEEEMTTLLSLDLVTRRPSYSPRLSLPVADLCQGVSCEDGGRCEAGKCVCPTRCPPSQGGEEDRLCGTDLNTVSSE